MSGAVHTSQQSLGGTDFLLILAEPDWSRQPRATVSMPAEIDEGVTGIAERRMAATSPRWAFEYRAQLSGWDLQQLRTALGVVPEALQQRPRVGIAFWPDLDTANPYITGPRVWWDWDNGYVEVEVTTGAEPSGGRDHSAPLLIGYLSNETFQAITDGLGVARLRLREDSPAALALTPAAPAPQGWEWEYDWARDPEQSIRSLSDTTEIGRGRERVQGGSPEVRLWRQRAGLTLKRADLRAFLAHYGAVGTVKAFAVPSALQPGSESPGAPHDFDGLDNAKVRHTGPVSIRFTLPDLAEVETNLEQEVSSEADQTPPAYAYLYEFLIPGEDPVRLTDWEAPVTSGGNAHTSAQVSHGRLRQSLKPQNENCEITVARNADPALVRLASLGIMEPVEARIVEAKTDGGDPQTLFVGTVRSIRAGQKTLRLTCAAFGGALGREVPRFGWSITCNHTLFGAGCGLAAAQWTFSGEIDQYWSSGQLWLAAGYTPAPAVSGTPHEADGWFRHGTLIMGTGAERQIREIRWSHMDGDPARLKIILDAPLRADIGEGPLDGRDVEFRPGCDGRRETCADKFANHDRFGGFPWLPPWIEQKPAGMPRGGK